MFVFGEWESKSERKRREEEEEEEEERERERENKIFWVGRKCRGSGRSWRMRTQSKYNRNFLKIKRKK